MGDLGYYAPGSDLVILGALDPDATSHLAEVPGEITAHVTVLDS